MNTLPKFNLQQPDELLVKLVRHLLITLDGVFVEDFDFTKCNIENFFETHLFEQITLSDPSNNFANLGHLYKAHKELCAYLEEKTLLQEYAGRKFDGMLE